MLQPQSRLTAVLKIYAVPALLYAVYSAVVMAISFVRIMPAPILVYCYDADILISLAVSIILVWRIYTGRDASALFLPCLILAITNVLVLSGFVLSILSSHESFSGWPFAFWYAGSAAVYLFIAVDARAGSKLALTELLILAALSVLEAIAAAASFALIARTFADQTILLKQTGRLALNLFFSPSSVIVLFLLRTHILRKKSAALPQPPEIL